MMIHMNQSVWCNIRFWRLLLVWIPSHRWAKPEPVGKSWVICLGPGFAFRGVGPKNPPSVALRFRWGVSTDNHWTTIVDTSGSWPGKNEKRSGAIGSWEIYCSNLIYPRCFAKPNLPCWGVPSVVQQLVIEQVPAFWSRDFFTVPPWSSMRVFGTTTTDFFSQIDEW